MILLFLTALGLAIGVARAYKYKSDKAVFYERLLLPVIFVAVGINGILFGFIPHVFFFRHDCGPNRLEQGQSIPT